MAEQSNRKGRKTVSNQSYIEEEKIQIGKGITTQGSHSNFFLHRIKLLNRAGA
jgi:hypothetical protein